MEKKIKQRLRAAYMHLIFGILLVAVAAWKNPENEFFFAFGVALLVIGIIRLRRYRKLLVSPEAMRAQEIAESDERNIMIDNKAKSWAFMWYIMICGTAVIILEFANQVQLATQLALSICFLMVLYSICYYVIKRKF